MNRIDHFLNNHDGRFAALAITAREAAYIIRKHRPVSNNAASLTWCGHFRVGKFAYCLEGSRRLIRVGEKEAQ